MDDRIPVWLDCDPGHDDAIALVMASFLPWFRLVGVSTVHGNASLENTTANAVLLLTAFEKFDVNVFPGAEMPLQKRSHVASEIHGTSGLDGTALLPSPRFSAQPDHTAVAAMAEAIQLNPGSIAVVATGCLTNIALLVEKFPQVIPKIKLLSIMGGGFSEGNWTPYAEFNIWADPLAAQIVLTNRNLAPVTLLVPLDLTHRAIATEAILERIQKGPPHPLIAANTANLKRSVVRQMLYELLTYFADTYRRKFKFEEGPPIHDPLAMAAILPFYHTKFANVPDIKLKYSTGDVKVIQSGDRIGQTTATPAPEGVMIAEDIDFDVFWDLVFQAVDTVAKDQDQNL